MRRRHATILAGCALAAGAIAFGATGAGAFDSADPVDDAQDANEGPDVPIAPGPDLDTASAVALDFTGEGRVTDTEIEDEESYYEVEVTLDDRSEVDVQLDESFNVVGTD